MEKLLRIVFSVKRGFNNNEVIFLTPRESLGSPQGRGREKGGDF